MLQFLLTIFELDQFQGFRYHFSYFICILFRINQKLKELLKQNVKDSKVFQLWQYILEFLKVSGDDLKEGP